MRRRPPITWWTLADHVRRSLSAKRHLSLMTCQVALVRPIPPGGERRTTMARRLRQWCNIALKAFWGLGCLAGTAALVIGGPGLIFGLLLWMASERTLYTRASSPDRSHEARVQFDDCGAPCGWAKAVFIKSRWMPSDSPLFSCAAFWGDGTNRIRLDWCSNSQLIVHHGFQQRGSYDAPKACGSISIVTRFDPSLVSDEP
jgi:hypothetical protein